MSARCRVDAASAPGLPRNPARERARSHAGLPRACTAASRQRSMRARVVASNPAIARLRLERALDQRAERNQQLVAARRQHAQVKAQVGAHPFVHLLRIAHRLVRGVDRGQRVGRPRAGGQPRRVRFHHLAHLLQLHRERERRRHLRIPVEQLRVEQVPGMARTHPRADLRPRLDQALRGQRAQRLAQHRAAHAERRHQVGLARQRRLGRVVAAQDRDREPERGLSMQITLNHGSPRRAACR